MKDKICQVHISRLELVLAGFRRAKDCIHTWHNMPPSTQEHVNILKEMMWEIYERDSPEMRRINESLKELEEIVKAHYDFLEVHNKPGTK
jgi:hypothetical protein